jgi:endonuclease/exonuclease/phosphatase (EEP) superfamily protein YafD
MRLAGRERADIVVIGEFPTYLPLDRRRALRGAFIYEAGEISGAETNVSMFSRSPLRDIRIANGRKRKGLLVAVQTSGGPIQIGGVHASVPFNQRAIADRAMSVRGVIAGAGDGPAIVVGDLNAVAWSPLLAEIEREGKARRISLGGASTWMSPWPFLGLPIDHAFVVGRADASARLGHGIGSDHLPLIVDVSLSQAQGLRPPLN